MFLILYCISIKIKRINLFIKKLVKSFKLEKNFSCWLTTWYFNEIAWYMSGHVLIQREHTWATLLQIVVNLVRVVLRLSLAQRINTQDAIRGRQHVQANAWIALLELLRHKSIPEAEHLFARIHLRLFLALLLKDYRLLWLIHGSLLPLRQIDSLILCQLINMNRLMHLLCMWVNINGHIVSVT